MRIVGVVVGLLLIVVGVIIWTAETAWTWVLGLVVAVVGLVILLRSARRRPAVVGPRT